MEVTIRLTSCTQWWVFYRKYLLMILFVINYGHFLNKTIVYLMLLGFESIEIAF